jgi:hypothetical protein
MQKDLGSVLNIPLSKAPIKLKINKLLFIKIEEEIQENERSTLRMGDNICESYSW